MRWRAREKNVLFTPWRWKWWLLLIRSVDGGDKIKTADGAGPVGGVGRRRPGRRGGSVARSSR